MGKVSFKWRTSIVFLTLWRIVFHNFGDIQCLPFKLHFGDLTAVGEDPVRQRVLSNQTILGFCDITEVVFLAHQKILNRNNRCALEEENVEMTHGLQEQFVFWSWVLWGKKSYFHGWLFFKWMYFQGKGERKGDRSWHPCREKLMLKPSSRICISCVLWNTVYS